MAQFKASRRQFLATTAAVGTTGLIGSSGLIVRAQEARVLTARANRDIANLDPGYMLGGRDNEVQNAVMPRLVDFTLIDNRLGWRPTAYVAYIGQSDPTHIDFALNPDFMWTNGFGELTAEDVKYSCERMAVSDWKADWEALDRVAIKDKYSGTLILKYPFAPFWSVTLAGSTGILVCAKATESVGGKYTTDIPATCGPYLYHWQPGREVTFTRNPEWTGPKPYFDRIRHITIEEDKAADLAFEAGETDISHAEGTTLARYRKFTPPHSNVHVAGALRYAWIGMNTEHPKLRDIRVRKAIQHAIDVDAILEGAYSGTAQRAYGTVCPGLIGKRHSTKIDYNPEKSRALLKQAGVVGLELEIRTRSDHTRLLTCQIAQANLAAVGISAKVIPMESGAFNNFFRESAGDNYKDSQLWFQRFKGAEDSYDQLSWFRRNQIGIWNWERWSDDEYEDLYDKGLLESDPDKRHAIYLRMQEIMEDTGAYVWLVHEENAFVHRDTIVPHISITGHLRFRDFKGV